MYNINFKPLKKKKRISLIIVLIGFIMLFISIYPYGIRMYKKYRTNSKITTNNVEVNKWMRIKEKHKYYVNRYVYHFEVDGKEYIYKPDIDFDLDKEVEETTIYYKKVNPSYNIGQIEIDYYKNDLILIIPFSLLIIISFIFNIIYSHKIHKLKKLRKVGKVYKVKYKRLLLFRKKKEYITQVEVLYNEKKLRYYIHSDYTILKDTGYIDLLIDDKNPKNYYMDLEIRKES